MRASLLLFSLLGLSACTTTRLADSGAGESPSMPTETIAAIQGPGDTSGKVGSTVQLNGVVTLVMSDGKAPVAFVIQDPKGDGKAGTSDALFVEWDQAAGLPAVGDRLTLRGTVTEEKGRTGLSHVGILERKAGQPLPEPMSVSLEDLQQGEALEGMRVRLSAPAMVVDVHDLGRYGSVDLSAGNRPFTPGSRVETLAGRKAEHARCVLDDGSLQQNPATIAWLGDALPPRVGDRITNATGVLEPFKDEWHLHGDGSCTITRDNPRTDAPPTVEGDVRIASFNVLNFFVNPGGRGADTDTEKERQQAKLVSALLALDADLYGLIEIENDNGEALTTLVKALNTARGNEEWAAVPDAPRGRGTDAIKQAVIYRPARLELVGAAHTDMDPVFSRPPVAVTVKPRDGGKAFSVVVNHLKSKGCGDAAGEEQDKGQGCWNALRTRQATRLALFVEELRTQGGPQDVLLLGDFNAYLEEDPLRALEQAGFRNLLRRLPEEDRYSYVYKGESGALDHALATPGLDAAVSGVGIWHINADESPLLDYNLEFKTTDRFRPDPFRSSDHDPVLVGLRFR